jgi:hypothetical protein
MIHSSGGWITRRSKKNYNIAPSIYKQHPKENCNHAIEFLASAGGLQRRALCCWMSGRVATRDCMRDDSSRFLPDLMLTKIFFSAIALIPCLRDEQGMPLATRMSGDLRRWWCWSALELEIVRVSCRFDDELALRDGYLLVSSSTLERLKSSSPIAVIVLLLF